MFSKAQLSAHVARGKPTGVDAKVKGIMGTMRDVYGMNEFKMNAAESSLISLPQRVWERNAFFVRYFTQGGKPKKLTIVDGYACVGGDSLSFMKMAVDNDLPVTIHSVQYDSGLGCEGRAGRLRHNLTYNTPYQHFEHLVDVTMMPKTMERYVKEDMSFDPDIFYVDPPWELPDNFEKAGSAKYPSVPTLTLVRRLEAEVFSHMGAYHPTLICIKAPTPFEEFRIVLFEVSPYLKGYAMIKSLPFRDKRGAIRLYYHILERKQAALDPGAAAFVPGGF